MSYLAPVFLASVAILVPVQIHSEQGLVPGSRVELGYGKLPLSFEANIGQTDRQVKFESRGQGFSLFLTDNEAVLALRKARSQDSEKRFVANGRLTHDNGSSSSGLTIRMQVIGANPATHATGAEGLSGKTNYFIGNDPSKWRTNVPTYSKVRYEGVYPGIDLVYHGNRGQLEYDFVIAPGADPSRIRLRLRGAQTIKIDDNGDLSLGSEGLRFQKPRVYQEVGGERHAIEGRYQIAADSTVRFQLGDYDPTHSLVIDPVVIYSTYLGGSGGELGRGIAVDHIGNAYVTGVTTSTDFPTANAFQPHFAGMSFDSSNVFITKINSNGSALVYSTYLGGEGSDFGSAIAVDAAGNAYVTGITGSLSFPIVNAFQPTTNPILLRLVTAFVTKINIDGSALVYSTYLGGSILDEGLGIAVDSKGSAYVTGTTQSRDFPTAQPIQSPTGDGIATSAFVTKFSPDGSSLMFSTLLVGDFTGADGDAIAVDSAGNVYVAGATGSPTFPTVNAVQPHLAGNLNAFVAKIKADGSSLLYSTYLGGSSDNGDFANGIAVDSEENAYITGTTYSSDFPTAHALQPTLAGGSDVFLTKINSAGSALVYSTYLGGTKGEFGTGIALDDANDVYLTGSTESADFPTHDALHATFGGGFEDAFVSEVNSSGTALIYSTYLGANGDDEAGAIALDAIGNVYVAGDTSSVNFPTTHPLQQDLGGTGATNAFVTKIASDRTDSLNLSGSVFFTNSSCSGGGSSCSANVVGWSGGFGHVPNGWAPFPGSEKALWEAHLTSEGEVAFGKTVTLTGGKLDLLLQGQKLLSETVTNGTVVWPTSATADLGCGDGVAEASINFQTAQGKPARFSGCVRDLPAGGVKPPQIWGIFQHVP